jgi:hypothetical protein
MILVTTFYWDCHSDRRNEFLHCIRRNSSNPAIDQIHIFIEDDSDPTTLTAMLGAPPDNTRLMKWHRRITYREMFGYANDNFAGRNVIIANGDIFFDESLRRLVDYDLTGKLLCLSRWDVRSDGTAHLFHHPASQDAWIFRAPIRDFSCDFFPGRPACDNRLAWEAGQAGLVVLNPSRSIRACHLHLSAVRRYAERDRLPGPVAAVPPSFLGSPWLWFVICAAGNPQNARRAAEVLSSHRRATGVVVAGSAAFTAGLLVGESHSEITAVTVAHPACSQGVEARNQIISMTDPDSILCFIDDGVLPDLGFSDFVLSHIDDATFFAPCQEEPRASTPLVCTKAAFERVGGFDCRFQGWGEEVADLADALRRHGLAARAIPANLLARGPGSNSCDPDRRVDGFGCDLGVHAAYRRAKSAILAQVDGGENAAAMLAHAYRAIRQEKLLGTIECPDVPLAGIAFCENMGYSLARLEPGQSSHNNDIRPFRAMPPPLLGLPFTQVVAYRVSPIEVVFLEGGKLYVLVGTDWEGHAVATNWLVGMGSREAFAPVETERGTTFEVWSVLGGTGDLIVVPTQVMLVAASLVRREASVAGPVHG